MSVDHKRVEEIAVQAATRRHWLLVEREDNWNQDRASGFTQFGIPERQEKLGRSIKKGDLLFFYVSSGKSSFADVREASESGVSKLPQGGQYDTPFPWRILTKPVFDAPTRGMGFDQTAYRRIIADTRQGLAASHAVQLAETGCGGCRLHPTGYGKSRQGKRHVCVDWWQQGTEAASVGATCWRNFKRTTRTALEDDHS